MDKNNMLGPHKFNLQAAIDHHGLSIHSGDYTLSTATKTFYCNDYIISEYETIATKNSSMTFIVISKCIMQSILY